MLSLKVRCPYCGAHDQITAGLDFKVGSRCWRHCSNCSKPFLMLRTNVRCETARLSVDVMSNPKKDHQQYLLEQEIELLKKLGLLPDEAWVKGEDLSQEADPEHDEFRCIHCKQAVNVPISKQMLQKLIRKNPVVFLTFCGACKQAMGVIFTGDLFSEEIVQSFKMDWDQIFRSEGEEAAKEMIEAEVREDFDIPDSCEVQFFNDNLPAYCGEEEEKEEGSGMPISEAEFNAFIHHDLKQIDDGEWWQEGGPDNPAHH